MLRKNPRDDRFGEASLQYEEDQPAAYATSDTDSPSDRVTRSNAATTATGESYDGSAAREARAQSVIDGNSAFDGHFEAAQDLIILGRISGEIVCRGLLTIERDATAKAKIQSRDAQIRGHVEGDIVCSGRLLLASTANVSGTLKAAALVVEEGATIRGTVETTSAPMADLSSAIDKTASRRAGAASDSTESTSTTARGGRTREVPTFALVSSDDRTALDRN